MQDIPMKRSCVWYLRDLRNYHLNLKKFYTLFLCMPVLANSVKTQCEDSKYQIPLKQFFTKLLYVYTYTGCPRRNVPDFGRVFLMLKYTDITQNTCVQSWMFTEIMAREVWNFDSCYTLIDYQIHIKTGRNMWFL